MTAYYYKKKEQECVPCNSGIIKPAFTPILPDNVDCVDQLPEAKVAQFYCAGDKIPLTSVGLVKVFTVDDEEICLTHGMEIPADIDGFVLMDSVTKKLKYVSGRAPINESVDPEIVQELFLAGDTLPLDMLGTVKISIGASVAPLTAAGMNALGITGGVETVATQTVAAGSVLHPAMIGHVIFDEVSKVALYVQDTHIEESRVAEIALEVFQANEQGLNEAEVIAIAQSIVDLQPHLSNDDVKVIAQACIDTLPPDQVRSDTEITALVTPLLDALAGQVLNADQVNALAAVVFADLASDFLVASDIYDYVQAEIDQLPPDTVRSDFEIKQIFENCIALLPEDRTDEEVLALVRTITDQISDTTRSDAEIKAIAEACQRTEADVIALIQSEIALIPPDVDRTDAQVMTLAASIDRTDSEVIALAQSVARTDDQIIALATGVVDSLDLITPDEVKLIFEQCLALQPADMVRTDAEINNLIQAFHDALPVPTDQVRTDAEIEAIAQALIDLLPPDTTRSDAEILALFNAWYAALPVVVDTVRSDGEINALIQQFIEDNPSTEWSEAQIKQIALTCYQSQTDQVRTDAEINALIMAIVSTLPPDTTRTDLEINTLIQAYFDALPVDEITNEAQVKSIVNACISALPVDNVHSEQDVLAIVQPLLNDFTNSQDLSFTEGTTPDGCFKTLTINYGGQQFVTTLFEQPTAYEIKRCYYGVSGIQTIRIETDSDSAYSVDFGHANDVQTGNNASGALEHDFGSAPVSACFTVRVNEPCAKITLFSLSPELLELSEPAPQGAYIYE